MKNREKAEKAKEPKKLIDGHAQITRKSDNQDKVSMPYKSNEKEKKG